MIIDYKCERNEGFSQGDRFDLYNFERVDRLFNFQACLVLPSINKLKYLTI